MIDWGVRSFELRHERDTLLWIHDGKARRGLTSRTPDRCEMYTSAPLLHRSTATSQPVFDMPITTTFFPWKPSALVYQRLSLTRDKWNHSPFVSLGVHDLALELLMSRNSGGERFTPRPGSHYDLVEGLCSDSTLTSDSYVPSLRRNFYGPLVASRLTGRWRWRG